MPIHEYECTSCGHKFEDFKKFNDPDPVCPKCGKEVKRLISAGKFELYGGGVHKPGLN